jgi:hypothetical protein
MTAPACRWSLDGVTMHVADTAPNGEVGAATTFRFVQRECQVSCEYAGGAIRSGFLIGRIDDDVLHFVYVQADHHGRLDAGESRGELGRLPDGRIRMTEHFRWFTRSGEGRNEFEELRVPEHACDSQVVDLRSDGAGEARE